MLKQTIADTFTLKIHSEPNTNYDTNKTELRFHDQSWNLKLSDLIDYAIKTKKLSGYSSCDSKLW